MKSIKHFLKKTSIVALAMVMSLSIGLAGMSASAAASPPCVSLPNGLFDSSTNAIIKNGAPSIATIQKAYASDATVRAVYNNFGITTNGINNLCTTAVAGRIYKNGDVYVGSKLVANRATTGRQPINGSTPVTYNGVTFYTQPASTLPVSDSAQAYVVMQDGHFRFGIIAMCGNEF